MLALLLALHPLPAPRPVAAPERFVITTRGVTNLDLSAAGQGAQSYTLLSKLFVSVSLSDSTGGRIANIVVDSNSFDAGALSGQLPPEMSASAKGAAFHLYVVNGKSVTPILPAPMSMQAAQASGGIELILAGLRAMKAGDSWTDTTTTERSTGEVSAKGTRIAVWTAKAGESGTLELNATWTGTTVGGAGDSQMEMKVSGTSHVSTVGGKLAKQGAVTGTGSATMNMGGMSVPMTITTETTVDPLP